MATKKQFQRVSYKTEPVLHVHRYIVTIGGYCKKKKCFKTRYIYCDNLNAVRVAKDQAKAGDVVEVFKAQHNFVRCWKRVK